MKKNIFGILALTVATLLLAFSGVVSSAKIPTYLDPIKEAFPTDYVKKRLIITTDIGGGDQDDTQSMIHFLLYADMFDIEGICVTRPKGTVGTLNEVLKAYAKDYKNLSFSSDGYPTPAKLHSLIYQGLPRGESPPEGYSHASDCSQAIIESATNGDPRPLYISVWGSITDTAQAIHDHPSIKAKLRVISSSQPNNQNYNARLDPTPYNYMRSHLGPLHWIEEDAAGRGFYLWGEHSHAKYGNVGFVEKVIRHHGELGKLFYRISADIDVNHYGLKMGDSEDVFFLFNGDFDNPEKGSWGGAYSKVRDNYYAGRPEESLKIAGWNGAKTVAVHKKWILLDFERRLKRLDPVI